MRKKHEILITILFLILIYFVTSILTTILVFTGPVISILEKIGMEWVSVFYALTISLIVSLIFIFKYKGKEISNKVLGIHIGYVILVFVTYSFTMIITGGSLAEPIMIANVVVAFPFLPVILVSSLISGVHIGAAAVGFVLLFSLVFIILLSKKYRLLFGGVICLICTCVCVYVYLDSPQHKYKIQSHNFAYMNGFSSIDLTEYTPYSDSGKLATLDHEPEFKIEDKEDMPKMDGAEACYPVYSAIAKAIYKDIDEIEENHRRMYGTVNGTIVSFYNTAVGFERLISGDVDMFFGAMPSESQLQLAKDNGVELEMTPIGKEAFVFFVNEKNPVESLTSDQVRDIYHGDIINWKEVGGKREEIIAFQRPERSGSQSMMVHFMGDVSLKEPVSFEKVDAMSGIIEYVADYYNEAGAIGYSFRYFLEGLNQQEDVKMLSIDGIYPSTDSITNDEYPIITPLYCITVKENDNENVQKVLEFILSEDGQYLVEQMGYSPVQ